MVSTIARRESKNHESFFWSFWWRFRESLHRESSSSSSSTAHSALHLQLGGGNKRCMGAKRCEGVRTGTYITSVPMLPAKRANVWGRGISDLGHGIDKMKQKGAICTAPWVLLPVVCSSQKDGGHRPIMNLKKLNQFAKPQHFKMESISMLRDILKQGDYMTKMDLKDAYFMVEKHWNLTRFTWKGTAYQFSCLPFESWVFTKITRPIMTILRSMGLRTIIYIDNILIVAK